MTFNELYDGASEMTAQVNALRINFAHVEFVIETDHGFLVCFSSGHRLFVSNEQKTEIVKRLEAKDD